MVDRRLRGRRRGRGDVLAEAGLDVVVLEAGGLLRPRHLPRASRSRRSPPLYRDGGLTVAEGRPAIPVPVGAGGRRHDGDQLGHLLSRARAGARELARASTGSTGRPIWTPSSPQAEEMLRVTPLDPERMGRNGQLCDGGRRGAGRQRRARSAATPATACSAAPARSAAGWTPSARMHVSYLPRAVAAGARVAPARRGPRGSWSRTAARSGSTGFAAGPGGAQRPPAPLQGPCPAR